MSRSLLVAPAAALVVGLVLGPLLLLVRVSLYEPAAGRGFYAPGTLTVTNYAALLDRYHAGYVLFTIGFAAAVTAVTVAVAYPLALFVRALTPDGQRLALALVLIPKTAGLLAAVFGLQRLLPRGLAAAVLTEAYLIGPYAVLVLVAQLNALDPALVAAARGLGASRWQAFRRVTLPLSRPGLGLASQLAFVWGLGAFLGPLFLGTPADWTLAVEVHRQAFEYGRWPRAAAEAVVLLVLVAGALAVTRAGGKR